MPLSKEKLWERFKKYYVDSPNIGLALDISRMNFADDVFHMIAPKVKSAFRQITELEKGAIANPDEKLQKLVLESLGKEKDLDGKVVTQGLIVLGNKRLNELTCLYATYYILIWIETTLQSWSSRRSLMETI